MASLNLPELLPVEVQVGLVNVGVDWRVPPLLHAMDTWPPALWMLSMWGGLAETAVVGALS